MKILILIACSFSFLFFACSDDKKATINLNEVAVKYVKLGLEIGRYDADFVDAYYGPDSLKPAAPIDTTIMKDSLMAQVNALVSQLDKHIETASTNDSTWHRATWMRQQLIAFGRRIKIFSGERTSFEKETEELFGVTVPTYNEQHFKDVINKLASTVPGNGSLETRLENLNSKFIIPKEKIDTVFKLALAEARKRAAMKLSVPAEENFSLEYVTGKSWSGYNWYKGNFNSLIQINTDLPIMIERAIDLACHEGYPGHHVYNMLLEKNLYRDKHWPEISLYPLFSPQSLIAEGSANYGIEMAFSQEEKYQFLTDVLLPAAGLDTINLSTYLKVLAYKSELNYARNEVARGLINKNMDEAEAKRWLVSYSLATPASADKSIVFITKYGSYVICYNYGQDLVKQYVEKGNASIEERWKRFQFLLSNPITPSQLQK